MGLAKSPFIPAWEDVTEPSDNTSTQRLAVTGGHLYRTIVWQHIEQETEHGSREWDEIRGVSMVFVPDSIERMMKRLIAAAPQMKELVEGLMNQGPSCVVCQGTRELAGGPCPACTSGGHP